MKQKVLQPPPYPSRGITWLRKIRRDNILIELVPVDEQEHMALYKTV